MTAASVDIRPLTAADRTAWNALWQDYLTFYESAVEDAVTEQSFARLTDANAQERGGFVACVDGETVGFVHFIYHAHNWRLSDVCYLQDLFVAPAARGLGVARSLINAVYAAADDAGCDGVYWLTAEDNTDARALYDKVAVKTPFIKYQRAST